MDSQTASQTPATPRKPWNDRNKCEFTGRLGAAPKINQKGDTVIVSGTIYVTNEFEDKKKGGIGKNEARINFVSYGPKALEFAQAAGKSDRVELKGKFRGNAWEKDGQKRYGLELVAFEPKVLSKYVPKTDKNAA